MPHREQRFQKTVNIFVSVDFISNFDKQQQKEYESICFKFSNSSCSIIQVLTLNLYLHSFWQVHFLYGIQKLFYLSDIKDYLVLIHDTNEIAFW